jgi:hypothetical protein
VSAILPVYCGAGGFDLRQVTTLAYFLCTFFTEVNPKYPFLLLSVEGYKAGGRKLPVEEQSIFSPSS